MTKVYNPVTDKELQNKISINTARCIKFNNEIDEDKRQQMINEIIGSVGKDCTIMPPFRCDLGENISIGNNSFINYNAIILDTGKVTIKDNVFIGPNLSIYTPIHPLTHELRNTCIEMSKDITIEDNCWLGGNVTVLAGVTIKEGCVIGTCSVVTKDTEQNGLYLGNPAKRVKNIDLTTEYDEFTSY